MAMPDNTVSKPNILLVKRMRADNTVSKQDIMVVNKIRAPLRRRRECCLALISFYKGFVTLVVIIVIMSARPSLTPGSNLFAVDKRVGLSADRESRRLFFAAGRFSSRLGISLVHKVAAVLLG